ncbi:hypothetical protein FRB93_010250, partial [Tulasnella sp. JGI-2019a]
MEGHTYLVKCVAVSPDGTTIVSGSNDNTLQLWDAKTGAVIGKVMEGHTNWVNCVAVSPDGTTIVSGSWDNTLRLWDAKTGAVIGKVMEGHTHSVNCVAFSGDGKHTIFTNSQGKNIMWDHITMTQASILEVKQPIDRSGFSFTYDAGGWVLHPRGKRIFWLPADLRGGIASHNSIIVVKNQKVPVFDVSAC